MSKLLVALRDSTMCWPTLTVQVYIPPWHWRLTPYVYCDSVPGHTRADGSRQAGWWGVDVAWLMVKVDLGWNRPPFSWESA